MGLDAARSGNSEKGFGGSELGVAVLPFSVGLVCSSPTKGERRTRFDRGEQGVGLHETMERKSVGKSSGRWVLGAYRVLAFCCLPQRTQGVVLRLQS